MSPSKVETTVDADFYDFPDLPPFPSSIPTVPLLRLSLHKLQNDDIEESNRFFQASKDLGFFYLDLRGSPEGEAILKSADALFGIGEELFDLDVEEKQKYNFVQNGSYFGYKGFAESVTDSKGTADANEFFMVSKDSILSETPTLPLPSLLNHARPLMHSFTISSHMIATVLLRLLSGHLGISAPSLESLHRLEAMSGDQVRFIKGPPQRQDNTRIALGEHTDFGSVTILFNRLGGLQVKVPPNSKTGISNSIESGSKADIESDQGRWMFVRPLPHHAMINLGDALSKFTAGILRSNIHRVVPAPGLQATGTKYSVVYFARPEDDVVLKRLVPPRQTEGSKSVEEGRGIDVKEEEGTMTSKEWILKRALARSTRATNSATVKRDSGGFPIGLGDTSK